MQGPTRDDIQLLQAAFASVSDNLAGLNATSAKFDQILSMLREQSDLVIKLGSMSMMLSDACADLLKRIEALESVHNPRSDSK